MRRAWLAIMAVVGVALIVLTFSDGLSLAEAWRGHSAAYALIAAMAFVAEYVDSSLGMGYGTTLTPILLIMGFAPLQIVPAVLLSELASGIGAGALHHALGNVDLGRGSRGRRVTAVIATSSILGTLAAVALALSLSAAAVKIYIGVMILGIGVFLLVGRCLPERFSWRRVVTLGLVAAFNKGLSGGGYGPIVTGGQILSGVDEKSAVGVTSLAEGLVCAVGLASYLLLEGAVAWELAAPLAVGAILSVPAATVTVKVLPAALLRRSIAYATVFLGVLTLARTLR